MRIHPEKKKFLFSEREYSIVKTKIGLLFLLAVVVGQVSYGQTWGSSEGTNNDQYILNLDKTNRFSALRLQTYTNKGWVLFNNGKFNWIYTTNSNLYQDVSGFPPLMTLQPDGNLGIGTATPKEKLDIRGNLYAEGNVSIGTSTPGDYKLAVNGKIRAKEIKVETSGWSDYVFEADYKLPTLAEVEQHIAEKGHLINIPSAKEVEEKGIYLGEMNKLLLEKIEELTLYTLQQEKQLQKQETTCQQLEEKLRVLEALINSYKNQK